MDEEQRKDLLKNIIDTLGKIADQHDMFVDANEGAAWTDEELYELHGALNPIKEILEL